MGWRVVFIFMLLVTTISGSVLLFAWWLIEKIMEKMGKTEYILKIFQVVNLFFLFPFSFIIVACLEKRFKIFRGYFLQFSSVMIVTGRVLFAIWLVGVVIQIVREIIEMWKQKNFFGTLFSCDKETKMVFWEVCDRLGIARDKVSLYQSYRSYVPCFSGVIHPKVVIPVGKYTSHQLNVIFVHELNHYLQKDLWVKNLYRVVRIIHFFNPITIILGKLIVLWSEFTCDCRSIEQIGEAKTYFTTILSAVSTSSTGSMLASDLFENQNEMKWRILHNTKYNKSVRVANAKGIVLAICVFLLSLAGTVVMTVSAGTLYVNTFKKTAYVNAVREESGKLLFEVQTGRSNQELLVVTKETMEPVMWDDTEETIAYQLPGKTCVNGEKIYYNVGDIIETRGSIRKFKDNVRIGLCDSDGNYHYVEVKLYLYDFSFVIEEPGYYFYHIENLNDEDVEISLDMFDAKVE